MSLIKQLWLAILLVTVLAFGSSLLISTLSARNYLQQQLQLKNMDNANMLALTLTQLPKDDTTVELQISAQFDTGHYRSIRLIGTDGDIKIERRFEGTYSSAPDWFVKLIPIRAEAGSATVQDGWMQYGVISVESHSSYVHDALWATTTRMLVWFVAGALVTGTIGSMLVRVMTRPLDQVVIQAQAISQRRFMTVPAPATLEFRQLVQAMNALSERVRDMLDAQTRRLEDLRRQHQLDALTGVANRKHFINLLESALTQEGSDSGGVLMIIRVAELAALNQTLGRARTDQILCDLAQVLKLRARSASSAHPGRLNGSDFALLLQGSFDGKSELAALEQHVERTAGSILRGTQTSSTLFYAACEFAAGSARNRVLSRLDRALVLAEQSGRPVCEGESTALIDCTDRSAWRLLIETAVAEHGVRLQTYPVIDANGHMLHLEAPLRLKLKEHWRNAGEFMPWAARVDITDHLDGLVLEQALDLIREERVDVGINISPQSLRKPDFQLKLQHLLAARPLEAIRLWLEVPAYGVIKYKADFESLCERVRPLGCKLGIEHVSDQLTQIEALHELGIDYIKLDAALIRDIDQDHNNKDVISGLCELAHTLGLVVIAEGVTTEAEKSALFNLGLDGVTGPVLSRL